MKIHFETCDPNGQIAEFIYQKNNEPDSFCHLCPRDRDGIEKELNRLFAKPEPMLLVLRDGEAAVKGVFILLVIPEEQYLETDWGFVSDPSVYDALFAYLRSTYPGFHLDAVVTKSNRTMAKAYEKHGLVFDKEQILMDLKDYTPKPVDARIVKYVPEYEASYRAIHDDEGLYWTAERMLKALDRYEVSLVLEKGEAVGYIEMTTGFDETEPIQILVNPECRGKGYGRALLQHAIENNMPKKMILEVYADNIPALSLYLSLGFQEKLREFLASTTV